MIKRGSVQPPFAGHGASLLPLYSLSSESSCAGGSKGSGAGAGRVAPPGSFWKDAQAHTGRTSCCGYKDPPASGRASALPDGKTPLHLQENDPDR